MWLGESPGSFPLDSFPRFQRLIAGGIRPREGPSCSSGEESSARSVGESWDEQAWGLGVSLPDLYCRCCWAVAQSSPKTLRRASHGPSRPPGSSRAALRPGRVSAGGEGRGGGACGARVGSSPGRGRCSRSPPTWVLSLGVGPKQPPEPPTCPRCHGNDSAHVDEEEREERRGGITTEEKRGREGARRAQGRVRRLQPPPVPTSETACPWVSGESWGPPLPVQRFPCPPWGPGAGWGGAIMRLQPLVSADPSSCPL